jgi:hypothetical protein
MTELPDFDRGWIPDEKLRDYLLNPDHRHGRSKHDFLIMHGFSSADWPVLKTTLLAHAGTAKVTLSRVDVWGSTYHAIGPLRSPDGRNPWIRAYWIVRRGDTRPQLTSFIPWPAGAGTRAG